MGEYDPDNRFARCVAEYRKEQQFFNRAPSVAELMAAPATVAESSDNRFTRCVAEERSSRNTVKLEAEDRFRCLKETPLQQVQNREPNRFDALRADNRFECLAEGYDRRRTYSDQDIRYPVARQQLSSRVDYESVNTTLKRMKESGELQTVKWEPRSELQRVLATSIRETASGVTTVSGTLRNPRSKKSLSVDDIEQFPSLLGSTVQKQVEQKQQEPLSKAKNILVEEIIEKDVEPEYVALFYSKGKMIEKPMYKDDDGNMTTEKPVEKRLVDKTPTYNKWSDVLKNKE